MVDTDVILEMKHICKSFGKNQVLRDVGITLHKGEVLGLIGENGAGKSTLIKILCGIYKMDQGEIILNGKKEVITDVLHARQIGISTIYQELSLFPDLNAVQNIFINHEIQHGKGMVMPMEQKQMRKIAQDLMMQLNVNINIDVPVRKLKLAQKQVIEIARTLYLNTQVIIMDEPTAALEEAEREQLFRLIRKLKRDGHSIIFISHHLDELLRVCDTVAILRDGEMVAVADVNNITTNDIVEKMIGKSLSNQYPKFEVPIGEELMQVKGLCRHGNYQDINFTLHRGEIIGIVGLEGCGKNEVVKAIFGCMAPDSGSVMIYGKPTDLSTVRKAMKQHIAYIPAERKTDGLFLQQSIGWNTTIAAIGKIMNGATISRRKETENTAAFINRLRIKCTSERNQVSSLSGGNQQKVMLARWMMTDAEIYLFEEPTRGIDVNAKTEVYTAIGECVKRGKGAIVVSSEEEEVLGICDKILVMNGGKICAVLKAAESSVAEIKSYAVQ